MKLLVISGSHRAGSESRRIADCLQKMLGRRQGVEAHVLDLHETKLPQWEPEYQTLAQSAGIDWAALSSQIEGCDGFVFITPEWHGLASPALKNLILCCNAKELANKPTLIVSVSAGMSGAYPVSELRANSGKNTKICYIPDHLVIKNCKSHLLDPKPETLTEEQSFVFERTENALDVLILYARHLSALREEGDALLKKFPNGM